MSQVEAVRCVKCGKLLYQIAIPEQVKGSIVVKGGSVDCKCPRCRQPYQFGIDELLKLIQSKQKVPLVTSKSDNGFLVDATLTVPFLILDEERRELIKKIQANPNQRTKIIEEFAKKHKEAKTERP